MKSFQNRPFKVPCYVLTSKGPAWPSLNRYELPASRRGRRGEEAGRFLANVSETWCRDNGTVSREPGAWIPAPQLVHCTKWVSALTFQGLHRGDWNRSSAKGAEHHTWDLAGPQEMSAPSHLWSPCLFTAFLTPKPHVPTSSKPPSSYPHVITRWASCFYCGHVSHMAPFVLGHGDAQEL